MIEIIDEKYFHLVNEHASYLFYVMKNGQLGHLYYGESLGKLTKNDLAYMTERNNKSAGTVKFLPDDNLFTLADRAQELPVYGSTDFKEGSLEVFEGQTPIYLNLKYVSYRIEKDKKRDLANPASYGENGESETLIVKLVDNQHMLAVEMSYTIFRNSAAIVKSQKLINLGEKTVTIQKMLSGVLELPTANYDFIHLAGAWLKERHLKKQNLTQGTVAIGSLKGASGHQHNPLMVLQAKNGTLDTGDVYAANLIYSGNFYGQIEVDEWDKTRLMLGINPSNFSWSLCKSNSFNSPEMVLMYSSKGTNGLSTALSDFTEMHIIDRKWMHKNRPIVFNNWEATYFNFNAASLIELAKQGKELGMECFVLDDGWFGHRDDDRSSLGDWYTDKNKFPDGIDTFACDIHDLDLQLGIWFEPEMISPKSQLYDNHPDWVVGPPNERKSVGRGQYVLDFTNPEVVQSIYEQMEKIIKSTKLDYIKWDMNRNITEAYSNYLAKNGIDQTEFFHRYILGVYDLYNRILSQFPNILIEGCAGGGGRFDLGILFYSPQIWPSDDSDAVERLSIETGTLLGYPLSAFVNHVSASPNHQISRHTSMKMRQDVAVFGSLGYELDLAKLSDTEKAEIKATILWYKQHRQLLTHGKFQQLSGPLDNGEEVVWSVVDNTQSEAVIGFYRVLAQPNPPALDYVQVPILADAKNYKINQTELASGSLLKRFGLRKPYQFNGANPEQAQVRGDFQSYLFHLVETK